MGVSEIRLQRNRPSISLRGCIKLAQRPHEVAESQMDGRGLGRSRERFLEELLGAAAVAPVMQDKTEKVQSFAAVGRCFEDLR